jgi:hypothetical protein
MSCSLSVGRSVKLLLVSPAQPFLASGVVEIFDQFLFNLLDMRVFQKWGILFD